MLELLNDDPLAKAVGTSSDRMAAILRLSRVLPRTLAGELTLRGYPDIGSDGVTLLLELGHRVATEEELRDQGGFPALKLSYVLERLTAAGYLKQITVPRGDSQTNSQGASQGKPMTGIALSDRGRNALDVLKEASQQIGTRPIMRFGPSAQAVVNGH